MAGSRSSSPPVLLAINQHYYPDVASTGQHLTDLAEYLAEHGTEVHVLTARAHYVDGRLESPSREARHGVAIRRVRTTTFGRQSKLGRIVDYATFYVRALWMVITAPGDDVTVLFLTTPPLLAVIGWFVNAAGIRRIRYGIWSMDLHPDAEIAAGMLRPTSPLGRLLLWLDARAFQKAAFVVDLGPYMKRRVVAKGVAEARTHTIPVWGQAEATQGRALKAELGLEGKFVVMYSGNAGLVHEFRDILESMRLLRDEPGIYFLFAGGGPRRAEIEAFAAEEQLTNFSYRPYFAREELGDALAVGDVHLISLGAPFVGISVPGKLYGIMAAGRPALFVGPTACETADTIRDADCGVTVDPSCGSAPQRIVDALRAYCSNPSSAREAGARGRAAFESSYSAAPNCAAFARVLQS
jgi:colanic acid biosynthesis glycosyl transferase WcaI